MPHTSISSSKRRSASSRSRVNTPIMSLAFTTSVSSPKRSSRLTTLPEKASFRLAESIFRSVAMFSLTCNGVGSFDLVLQLDDAIQQRLGSRWATGNVDIHRNDAVTTTNHRIGIMVIAAAVCARAHRDHPARLSHLVVNLAQSRGHLVAQRTGHDHYIGLTRAGTECAGTKTVQVIARQCRMHHLNRTAGEAEGHRPQRTSACVVDHRVRSCRDETLFKYAFNTHTSPPSSCTAAFAGSHIPAARVPAPLALLLPFQCPFHPFVDKANY